jgi:hypothetical protein
MARLRMHEQSSDLSTMRRVRSRRELQLHRSDDPRRLLSDEQYRCLLTASISSSTNWSISLACSDPVESRLICIMLSACS